MGEFPDDLHDETGPLLLQSKDIQPGDIILWKGNPAEFLDLLIMSLTESDCSHATIVYDTNLDPDHPDYHGYDTMVCEETSYGVHASMTVDKKDWRIGYVRRPKCLMGDNALPFQPVKELCAKYVRQNNKYNTADFAALTVLLLLKNYTPEIDLQLDIITLLEMAAHFLNSTFFAIAEPKKAAEGGLLTCSSFVYHVYEEASEKEPGYKLKVVDGVCANMKRDVIPSPLEQPIKFIDYLISDLSHDASLAGDLARVVFELGEHIINLAEDKIEDVFHSIYDWVTHHIIKGDSGEPTNQERLAATVDADPHEEPLCIRPRARHRRQPVQVPAPRDDVGRHQGHGRERPCRAPALAARRLRLRMDGDADRP
ncbi:hypothetical protein J8273_4396 [Carpediemonas membranifera]|uniref:Uncharacterized protein n=1 Tax=Carpediemonas membranifera TaxID=201153 RepID=A0A8J6ATX2_9EUKA|nr:hypothetical protein J8273_4396 [Carpediemonas membranifera]|eukprot:KAG9394033.1 hypothetical protein J8273_4396 [Carpediemonas membranifera]